MLVCFVFFLVFESLNRIPNGFVTPPYSCLLVLNKMWWYGQNILSRCFFFLGYGKISQCFLFAHCVPSSTLIPLAFFHKYTGTIIMVVRHTHKQNPEPEIQKNNNKSLLVFIWIMTDGTLMVCWTKKFMDSIRPVPFGMHA